MGKKYFHFTGFLILLCLYLSSCQDSASNTGPEDLKITSINPVNGAPGDTVTINGSGFNTATLSSNIVAFNGTNAEIISVTPTAIISKVPDGAKSGRVSVSIGEQIKEGPEFEILSTGAVEVIIRTSGPDQDRDGYVINIDAQRTLEASINDTLLFSNVEKGNRQLVLDDLDNACSVSSENPQSILVAEQDTTQTIIEVQCEEVVLRNKIVYKHCEEECDGIYIIDIDGSNPKQLTSHPWDSDPVISPDGTKVAFVSKRRHPDSSELHNEIYIVDASGYPITNIPRPPDSSQDQDPSWSRDGKKIVFTQDSKSSNSLDIASVNADGTGRKKLTDDHPHDILPLYTSDGSEIVFYSFNRFGNTQLFIMNSDGSNIRQLTDNDFSILYPAISNDGSMLAFDVQGDPQQIYVMNIDGTEIRRLTNDSDSYAFASWSPDDSQLIFYNSDTSDIYKINLDGTGLTKITNSPGIEEPYPHWSPVQ